MCAAAQSVREYILIGESDSSTCGDAWGTWGVPPERAEEYGIYDDTPAPYEADGFVRSELDEISEWTVCRFDSKAARGFSRAVGFRRTAA